MKKSRALRRFGALAAALFTVYLLLDTFVIERSYASTAASEAESALFPAIDSVQSSAKKNTEPIACELSYTGEPSGEKAASLPADAEQIGSYSAEGKEIRLYSFRSDDTQVYVADIILSSAQALRTAFAEGVYGRNVTDRTSAIASDVGAVLAINGDFYGSRESGLVIRNGVLYRDGGVGGEVLVIYADGSFEILSGGEKSGEELLDAGAWQAFSFGPGLVKDGTVSASAGEEVGRSMASNPRTAIGVIEQGHYLFVVSDGRTAQSRGLSLEQLAELMASLGCSQAYNLDGGGSSAMVFQDMVVNRPTTNGRKISERSVSDIVYIG